MSNCVEIVGHSATLLEPSSCPDQYKFIVAKAYLLPLAANPASLVDRYDVRHSMESGHFAAIKQFKQRCSSQDRLPAYLQDDDVPLSAEKIEEIETERYRDFSESGLDTDIEQSPESDESDPVHTKPTAPFIHPSRMRHIDGDLTANEMQFRPSFNVPDHIKFIPRTLEEHNLIEKTSQFVRAKGVQPEILLKVKQASNPKFAFLQPDHCHHDYYEYLKDTGLQHQTIEEISSHDRSNRGHSPPEDDRIASQIADIKRRLRPAASESPVNVPDRKTGLVMRRLLDHITQFGIWFEASVQERHVHGDHLDFLEPDNQFHSFYIRLKQETLLAASEKRDFQAKFNEANLKNAQQNRLGSGSLKTSLSNSPERSRSDSDSKSESSREWRRRRRRRCSSPSPSTFTYSYKRRRHR